MIAREAVSTFEDLDGYRIARSFGYVSGIASRPRNRLRSTFRTLGMLIGVASEYVSDAEALRAEALEGLYARAETCGANAVVGLQFYVSEGPEGSCKVVAFGQAVTAEKLEPRAPS